MAVPALFGPFIGHVTDKLGPRYVATSGFLLATPLLVLLRLVNNASFGHKALLCVLLALIGLSFNLIITPLAAEVTYIVVQKEQAHPGLFGCRGAYAQAYSLFNMAFAAGCMVGPIWAGQVNDAVGWGTMAWSLALLSGVTSVPTFLWAGGWIFGKKSVIEDSRANVQIN